MTIDAVALRKELSEEEIGILIAVKDTGLAMFKPHNNALVTSLVQRGFVVSKPASDPDHTLLSLSDKGKAVAQLVLDERECPPT